MAFHIPFDRFTTSPIFKVTTQLDLEEALSESSIMDLDKIKSTVSNLTLYDIKAGVRSLQNGMLPTDHIGRHGPNPGIQLS
jgi:hypothetical protein